MRHRPKHLFAVAVLTMAVVLIASAQAATPPPTLEGELFVDPAPTVTGTCNPDGTSTIYFEAAGTASGPYNGTFTETGTATIGPQAFTDPPINSSRTGPVVTFDAIFTITSGSTEITGTKTLALVNGSQAIGQCFTLGLARALNVIALDSVSYQAAIATGDATYSDHGRSPRVFVQHTENPIPQVVFEFFLQDFHSDLPAPEPLTSGHATGGGQVPADASFGFEVKSTAQGVKGGCTVIDRTAGSKVKCLDVTFYNQTGTHATFSGHATVNGVATTYRIDVDDAGEPGAGQDTFKIVAGTYSAGGRLTEGNVQIHSG
jgi:hypothetical protein